MWLYRKPKLLLIQLISAPASQPRHSISRLRSRSYIRSQLCILNKLVTLLADFNLKELTLYFLLAPIP